MPLGNRKLKVLTFVPAYLPGFKAGGPIRSVATLVEALGDEIDFRVVTADRDLGDDVPYPDIITGCWRDVGKAGVIYRAPHQLRLLPMASLIRRTPHDAIYLNSFFSPRFTIGPLMAMRLGLVRRKPVILAPRGEFSAGALALKQAKKRLFLAAARTLGLYRKITFQVSSAFEQDDIIRALPGIATMSNVRIAANVPRKPDEAGTRAPRRPGEPLRIVFLSRISPMKNLAFALEVLREVKVPVRFTIHGPREDQAYWRQCQKIMESLPPHIQIRVEGAVKPDGVIAALAAHDLFFLPSRGENFGQAIAEALQAGLRLLISDVTPWRSLAEADVGHDLPLSNLKSFAAAIEAESGRPSDHRQAEINKAFLASQWAVDETIRQSRELFSLRGWPAEGTPS